jgi:integrase/recombinase XerC
VKAMLDYLYISIVDQKVKKTTWELRLVAIRRHLIVTHGVDFEQESRVVPTLKALRALFKEEGRADQIRLEGKSAVDKQELLDMIYKLPVRERAITFVNLVTANRPSEMVRMKVKDFNLEGRFLSVYLEKQSVWHNKRLTQEVIKAIRDYIHLYKLKQDDYFVGRVYKNGRYESVKVTEIGYTKALRKWTGLTGYNFRKSQVVAMHEAGADLPTIAKQTGHRSLEVLSKHYLTISDSTVDKYL